MELVKSVFLQTSATSDAVTDHKLPASTCTLARVCNLFISMVVNPNTIYARHKDLTRTAMRFSQHSGWMGKPVMHRIVFCRHQRPVLSSAHLSDSVEKEMKP